MVVVVDGNEQVGLPSLVEEAIFRAGSHRPAQDLSRIAPVTYPLGWPQQKQPIPTVLHMRSSWIRKKETSLRVEDIC